MLDLPRLPAVEYWLLSYNALRPHNLCVTHTGAGQLSALGRGLLGTGTSPRKLISYFESIAILDCRRLHIRLRPR